MDTVTFIATDQLGAAVEFLCKEATQDPSFSTRQRVASFNKAARILKTLGLVEVASYQAITSITYGVNYLGSYGVVVVVGQPDKRVN